MAPNRAARAASRTNSAEVTSSRRFGRRQEIAKDAAASAESHPNGPTQRSSGMARSSPMAARIASATSGATPAAAEGEPTPAHPRTTPSGVRKGVSPTGLARPARSTPTPTARIGARSERTRSTSARRLAGRMARSSPFTATKIPTTATPASTDWWRFAQSESATGSTASSAFFPAAKRRSATSEKASRTFANISGRGTALPL